MNNIVRHGLIWLVIYVVYTVMLSFNEDPYAIMLYNVLNISLYMGAYYLLRYVQLPLFYHRNKKLWFVFSLLTTSIFLYFVFRLGMECLDGVRGMSSKLRYDVKADFLVKVIRFYSPATVLLALESHLEGKKERVKIHQLEKEKIANELKFLKAQINPHFLFNTLHNLYAYVLEDSAIAPDMILRLSSILDYVLYKSQSDAVRLSEELETIENFLHLEMIRCGDRLVVENNMDAGSSVLISPLILLSIVEYVFKNGTKESIESPKICIHVFVDKQYVQCSITYVQNKKEESLKGVNNHGLDLSNIRRQLDLVYPDSHTLSIEDEADYREIQLTLNPMP